MCWGSGCSPGRGQLGGLLLLQEPLLLLGGGWTVWLGWGCVSAAPDEHPWPHLSSPTLTPSLPWGCQQPL